MRYVWTVFWLLGGAVEALLAARLHRHAFSLLGLMAIIMATINMRRTPWYRSLIASYATGQPESAGKEPHEPQLAD